MKGFAVIFLLAAGMLPLAAATAAPAVSARALSETAAKEASVTDSIAYLQKHIPALTDAAEKRAAYVFLGSVQEQAGLYADAVASYTQAAAIAAGDAPSMPKKTNEELVLDAVRCALSSGDTATADSYLASAVRASKSGTVLAYVKLYEQWSALCKSSSPAATAEPVAMLTAYSGLESMKAVQPAVLLTLWHITGEKSWADALKKNFPKSPEAAIVQGSAQQLPAPFWYFVPRKNGAVPEVKSAALAESGTSTAGPASAAASARAAAGPVTPTAPASKDEAASEESEKAVKQQLGLFREEANAERLVQQAKDKGFKAYITSEVRPSGTKYYLVVVDENKAGTMAQELRNAGFDCYPVF